MCSSRCALVVLVTAIVLLGGCTCADAASSALPPAAPPPAAPPAEPAPEPPAHAERAILIVVDSLRPEDIGEPSDTPALARLAREGSAFRAVSAATSCKPAVASMLTSLDPDRHGAQEDVDALPQAVWTLPEALRCHGVATASFLANGYLSARFGFTQGWDHHVNYIREGRRSTADAVLGDALAWITAHRDRRFFVYVHLVDPHVPYDPPPPFAPPEQPGMPAPAETGELVVRLGSRRREASEAEVRWLRELRRGEVHFVDSELGGFLARLDELGLGASTLVALTSDHGEALGEDGLFGHGHDSSALLPVPLLFRGPARPAPGDEVVSTRDLAPTILEAMGFDIPVRFEGRSFGPRRLRAPDRPPVEYPPASLQLDRETCWAISQGYGAPSLGDCRDYPTTAELAEGGREGEHTPCPDPPEHGP